MNAPDPAQYTVVARRYRPQSFEDLVGQERISRALGNAIRHQRVGHAYLFTGARGVGKTSSARIFAKCLNCEKGPTATPCNECDICQMVSLGEDVDVLEIDGASNNGVDEIRQLRSNANVRPSRSRFKIYIIDEVHMLSKPAFNALLKTLEEPPEHVKFIFCTTDPHKIPITVLSRCQRFDFSPVQTAEIADRLKEICQAEGFQADDEALAVLARCAGGSMRDSQSLLEQLFSFCDRCISVEDVNRLLGTADNRRVAGLAAAMAIGNSGASLEMIHASVQEGIDIGQLAEQTLGYFRDAMTQRVNANSDVLLHCGPSDMVELDRLSEQLGLEKILSIVQILDQAVVRMQSSMHTRILFESAVVRICNLENLDLLADLVNQLGPENASPSASTASSQPATAAKKNETAATELPKSVTVESLSESPISHLTQPANTDTTANIPASLTKHPDSESSDDDLAASSNRSAERTQTAEKVVQSDSNHPVPTASAKIDSKNVDEVWRQVIASFQDVTADLASQYRKVELPRPDNLVVTFRDKYTSDQCNRPERKGKLESILYETTGRRIRIDFVACNESSAENHAPALTRVQQIRQLEKNPLVKSAIELFDAEVVDFQRPKAKD